MGYAISVFWKGVDDLRTWSSDPSLAVGGRHNQYCRREEASIGLLIIQMWNLSRLSHPNEWQNLESQEERQVENQLMTLFESHMIVIDSCLGDQKINLAEGGI